MVRTLTVAALTLTLVLSASRAALAWLRPRFEDAVIVNRSELIVVGHLQKESIRKVDHKKGRDEGVSWEHHATLVITHVLKGKSEKWEIPVIIHYGLDPIVRADNKDIPENVIQIVDTGNSSHSGASLVKNAGEDNLWLLRRRSGIYGREPGNGNYGITDPEDLQPLEFKDYLMSYLADDPANAVKDYVRKNPDHVERAKRYLDHLEVERVLTIDDLGKRYDALLPFFLNRTMWGMKQPARDGIVGCGATGGERLKAIFADPKQRRFRQEIIRMWRDMGYREIAPVLIDLLQQHDRFWAKQDLQKGWWSDQSDQAQTSRRQDIYGEVYTAVYTLRSFRDPNARDVLEMTRKRWTAINFDNKQIIEECEAALRELNAK